MSATIKITAKPHGTVKVTINPVRTGTPENSWILRAEDAILWGKYLAEAGQYAKDDTERKWEITG